MVWDGGSRVVGSADPQNRVSYTPDFAILRFAIKTEKYLLLALLRTGADTQPSTEEISACSAGVRAGARSLPSSNSFHFPMPT